MNNFLAKCLGITTIIIALSIAYYAMAYLPQANQTHSQQQSRLQSESDLANKEKCVTYGEKLYKQDQADALITSGAAFLESPTYYYNKKLNTCLYSVETAFPIGNMKCAPYDIKVVDSFTGETYLAITQNGPTCETTMSRDVFDKKYNELFSE